MIDPQQAVSFSLASTPRVYALLLGSGVSRSAGIPTGWEVVLDLLGKLAAADGETVETDRVEWYRQKYQSEPEYSALLDALAREPAERQRLLRPYFEPNEHDAEQGSKRPTAAHKAIAQMVADGLIRVIITTNFDQLIETAIREAGVVPTVLSTADQVAGALPLIHMDCCVLKVHGDYMDPRILNSPSELSAYRPEVDRLLDQIFDEFGLIVCGWSGEWDEALRNAILRSPTRRFTTYWASRGELSAEAQKVADHRRAQIIQIEDADAFFAAIRDSVASITEFSRPHPLSTEAAVETMKRFMPSAEHRIRLSDHINDVVRRLVSATDQDTFPLNGAVNQDTFVQRVETYESVSSTLMAMGVVAGYWAEPQHFRDWERAIRQIYETGEVGGNDVWIRLRNYPALLLLYSLGMGTVASGRLEFLAHLFDMTANRRLWTSDQSSVFAGLDVDVWGLEWHRFLPGKANHYTPFDDRMHDLLKSYADRLLLSDEQYSLHFTKLEILMGLNLAQTHNRGWPWFRVGSFLHRPRTRQHVMGEMKDSLETHAEQSDLVTSGVLGSSAAECLEILQRFEEYVIKVAHARGVWTPVY